MENYVQESNPPLLKFSPPSFRESPPPSFNPEIFQPPPLSKFWLESQPPLPLERGDGHYDSHMRRVARFVTVCTT